MEAEDLLDKFAQNEGFGNWDTVVLNCHHSVIRSVAIAAVNEALRQPLVSSSFSSESDHICMMHIDKQRICMVCGKQNCC